MTIIDDIIAAEEATLTKLASITNAHAAVQTALDAQTKKIAQLTSDLLAAVNSNNNAAMLQAVLDKANAILASSDNAAIAAAALANTGSGEAPPVEPATIKVDSISPTSGPEAGGDTVSIVGSGFADTKDVTFNGVSVSFTINNDTSISAIAPAGTGTADIVVVGHDASSDPVQFTYVTTEVTPEPEPTPTEEEETVDTAESPSRSRRGR